MRIVRAFGRSVVLQLFLPKCLFLDRTPNPTDRTTDRPTDVLEFNRRPDICTCEERNKENDLAAEEGDAFQVLKVIFQASK